MRMTVFLSKKLSRPRVSACQFKAISQFRELVARRAATGKWVAADLTDDNGVEVAAWEAAAHPEYAIPFDRVKDSVEFAGGRLWVRKTVY